MKAMWNDTVIAEADKSDLLRIEGNWYFPPESIKREYYHNSDHRTICPWKGEAYYYDVVVDDIPNKFGAWYYPEPLAGSEERARGNFKDYVAFWNGIEITE